MDLSDETARQLRKRRKKRKDEKQDDDGKDDNDNEYRDLIDDEMRRDRNRKMAQLADRSSSLDFEINETKGHIVINYANIKSLGVNFFTMNIEVVFSERPFLGLNDPNENAKTRLNPDSNRHVW